MTAREESDFVRSFRRKWCVKYGIPFGNAEYPAEFDDVVQLAIEAFNDMERRRADGSL